MKNKSFGNVLPDDVPALLKRAALLGKEIRLTRTHIREGNKGSCQLCPIALAILEALPGARVNADLPDITVNEVTYETPKRVERFMNRFDHTTNRHNISGFKFTLEKLSYWQRPWATEGKCAEGKQ